MVEKEKILFHLRENRKYLEVAALILALITICVFLFIKGKSQNVTLDEVNVEASEEHSALENESADQKQSKVYVDVGGQVRSPGVYELSTSARVYQAIEKAGGLRKNADTSEINQAEQVKDGQKIHVPKKGETAKTSENSVGNESSNSQASEVTGLVNINTADSAKLQEIPGIGPVTAEKIITYREENGGFKKKEDLKEISGIGDKTYEKMEPVITI